MAQGFGTSDATRMAGFSWGGHAARRCREEKVVARVEELKPLVETGAGPDLLSQVLARMTNAAFDQRTPEALEAAARIAFKVDLVRKRALALEPLAIRRRRRKGEVGAAGAGGGEAGGASPIAEAHPPAPDMAIAMDEWLAWSGGEVAGA
jgi:hypothetical protein